MRAKDLEKKFDADEDILKYLDMTKAQRPGQEQAFAAAGGRAPASECGRAPCRGTCRRA
jgi:hypothetical protein